MTAAANMGGDGDDDGETCFIRVPSGADDVRITNNYFIGPPTSQHLTVGPGTVMRDMFVMSISDPRTRLVISLVAPAHGRWRRFWQAIARFALRRL